MRKTISKSCAYIGILTALILIAFIVLMDVLKYIFGIDPVRDEQERIRREKRAKKAKRPIITRYTYVHAPPAASTSERRKTFITKWFRSVDG